VCLAVVKMGREGEGGGACHLCLVAGNTVCDLYGRSCLVALRWESHEDLYAPLTFYSKHIYDSFHTCIDNRRL